MKIPENWILNPKTQKYDVQGSVSREDLRPFVQDGKLTISFEKVTGFFECSQLGLVSLEGCPQEVGSDFFCFQNSLVTLEGSPQNVGGGFVCFENLLESLEGAPQQISRFFNCSQNCLKTLEGAPQVVVDSFVCFGNPLVSLEGCPQNSREYVWNGVWYKSFEKFRQAFEKFQIIEKSKKLLKILPKTM